MKLFVLETQSRFNWNHKINKRTFEVFFHELERFYHDFSTFFSEFIGKMKISKSRRYLRLSKPKPSKTDSQLFQYSRIMDFPYGIHIYWLNSFVFDIKISTWTNECINCSCINEYSWKCLKNVSFIIIIEWSRRWSEQLSSQWWWQKDLHRQQS